MAEQVCSGRDPTDQEQSSQCQWLVNQIRTPESDIAMIGTKLNAQVIIKNLQNMHAKSLPPTGTGACARGRIELEYQDWARPAAALASIEGRGPHTGGPKLEPRLVGWRMWWSLVTDNDSPADSTLTDRFLVDINLNLIIMILKA